MKVLVGWFFISSFLFSCAQEQNKITMDGYKLKLADKIQKYDKQPYYTLQINKQNCRVLVRINDLPFPWNFFEDEGESVLLPINNQIPKSGGQTITIEVYPMSTQTFIRNLAHVNIKLVYAPDRHTPMDEFEVLKEWNLPEFLEDKKLQKYELKGTFQAQVPFDFSEELITAQDLSKIPDIEKKVVDKYKQLSKIIEQADGYSFLKEIGDFNVKHWSHNYFTKKEVEANPESENDLYNLTLLGREIAPIENYELVFYHDNKVVVLRDKTDKSFFPKVYFWLEDEGKKEKVFVNRFIDLYMPEGSNELKVW